MSKRDFPPEEFEARLRMVRESMDREGLDWLLTMNPSSIHWLTGSEAPATPGIQSLLVPGAADGPMALLARVEEHPEIDDDAAVATVHPWGGDEAHDPVDALIAMARRVGAAGSARVGMETPVFGVLPADMRRIEAGFGQRLIDGGPLIHDLRLVKSTRELELIRDAAFIADLSMAVLRQALDAGRSELQIAADICHAVMSSGGHMTAGTALSSGSRADAITGEPTTRRLSAGESGTADHTVAFRRHTAAIGRPFYLGAPDARLQRAAELSRLAADRAMETIADGVPASTPYRAAADALEESGVEIRPMSSAGHALAPAFPPGPQDRLRLRPCSPYTLREGMVLAVGPPVVMTAERIGVRFTDTVLVTATGAERLSTAPREIVVAG